MSLFAAILPLSGAGQTSSPSPSENATHFIKQEIARLEKCQPVTKVSPPPVHVKVIWKTPADIHLVSLTESKEDPDTYNAVIEFTIDYEQSNFFNTAEEAQKASEFQLVFATRHRHKYLVSQSGAKLVSAEYFNDSSKKWEEEEPPPPFCWEAK